MSIEKANDYSQGLISHGTLYLPNNSNDIAISNLISKATDLVNSFSDDDSYKKKLELWNRLGIRLSEIWIGDTSLIIERPNAFVYSGSIKPEPDILLSISPKSHAEIVDFNITNISLRIQQVGTFEEYRLAYLEHMKIHGGSPLYEKKLTMDLNSAESNISGYSHWSPDFKISLRDWYNSFTNQHDTLQEKDYTIWNLGQPLSELPLMSSKGKKDTPYLLYLIDDMNDISRAANAYILHRQIPFLRKIKDDRLKKILEETAQYLSTNDSKNVSETNDSNAKGSKKDNKRFTTKQQMILLNLLGFLDASVINKLTNQHKAAILAQLLNRNVQEIRGMLTYWKGQDGPKDYDCNHPDDLEKVIDFLSNNNLDI